MSNPSAHTATLPQAIEIALQHHRAGQFVEAETAYRQVLAVNSEHIDALHMLGALSCQLGNYDVAIDLISKSLSHNDNNPEALNNLGASYSGSKRLKEAEGCYRKAIAIRPDYADAHSNLGNALRDMGRLLEAEVAFRRAIALKPDFALAHNILGSTLDDLGRLEEAETAYRQAIAFKPDYVDAYNNLGNVIKSQGNLMDAEEAYRKSVSLKPDYVQVQWNLSLLKLLQGNFEEGFNLYERRFEGGPYNTFNNTKKLIDQLKGYERWDGEPLEGLSLLIIAEQGAGDNLMVLRYLTLLKQKNLKQLIVYSYPTLERVIKCMPGVDDVVSTTEPLPFGRFDMYCPIMSLPYLFQTRIDTIPHDAPYFVVSENLKQEWQKRLSCLSEMKVGLVWAGGKLTSTDKKRSIPLNKFTPLLAIDGISWVSLQKGEESGQLSEVGCSILNLMEECVDYLDTAALISQLDLVISVDTSVAHLAGALGKPVWLLNRFDSEWRWQLEREDSPWYPSMRIFRQTERGDWDSVIKRVAGELATLPLIG